MWGEGGPGLQDAYSGSGSVGRNNSLRAQSLVRVHSVGRVVGPYNPGRVCVQRAGDLATARWRRSA